MSSDRPRKRHRGDRGDGMAAPPGVGPDGPFGLLWAEPPAATQARGRGRGRQLDRDQIVRAALKLADAEGSPDAVSMRRIAAELGVGTMSLYHHVPTKDDLLDLMQDVVMGELVIPDDELPDNWRDGLAAISRRTYATYLRHPWIVAGGWERPQMGPRSFAHVEQSLSIFADVTHATSAEINEILGAADDYVIGFATRQLATERALRRSNLTMDEFREAIQPYVKRMMEAGDYPFLARASSEGWHMDRDRFEAGLTFMLDGVEAFLARRQRSTEK
jgi:AcrR family transcriptional regulator